MCGPCLSIFIVSVFRPFYLAAVDLHRPVPHTPWKQFGNGALYVAQVLRFGGSCAVIPFATVAMIPCRSGESKGYDKGYGYFLQKVAPKLKNKESSFVCVRRFTFTKAMPQIWQTIVAQRFLAITKFSLSFLQKQCRRYRNR